MPGQGMLSQPQKVQARRKARLLILRPSPPTQASMAEVFGHKKTPSVCLGFSGVGGPKRTFRFVEAVNRFSTKTAPKVLP